MILLNYLAQHNLSRKCGLQNCILLSSASCIIFFCSRKLWSCSTVQQLSLIFNWPPYTCLCFQPRMKRFQASLQQGSWFYRLVEYTLRFSVNNLSLNFHNLDSENKDFLLACVVVCPQPLSKPYTATCSLPVLGWGRELEKWENFETKLLETKSA